MTDGMSAHRLHELSRSVEEIEHNLRAVLAHLGLNWSEPTGIPPDLAVALERGDKVTAARLYREWRQVGLSEAMVAIEELLGER